jgi:hypothetical protein
MAKPAEHKPSVFYFRRALRDAATRTEAIAVGLVAVRELEALQGWIREQGLQLPQFWALESEVRDKGLERAQ